MQIFFLENVQPTYHLKTHEFFGEPFQTTYFDQHGFEHKGRTVEELKSDGLVGLYIPLDKWLERNRYNHGN